MYTTDAPRFCRPAMTSNAGDSRMSVMFFLYAMPLMSAFAPFTALPRSLRASAARCTTYSGMPLFTLSASSMNFAWNFSSRSFHERYSGSIGMQ